ncbi:MAG: hypothetical protein P1P90_05125 [Patescibacteria group bacterium]|nr:hypothetical protein [Patescibacteria group bacterium]
MALEATHLRFALEIEPRLNISNRGLYLAGSIYPDSRYTTGIHRNLTHKLPAPNNPFQKDLTDFQKGWATHIYYDEHGLPKYKQLSPWPDQHVSGFGDFWVFITAEKLVEDLQSYEFIKDNTEIIQNIQTPEPPNNEDPKLLKKYFQENKLLYSKSPNFQSYSSQFKALGLDDDLINQVINKTKEFQTDPEMLKKIESIYNQIIEEM